MTLAVFKINVSALLKSRGDIKLSSDNADIIPLISIAMLNVANRYKVLKLMTKSENFKVLRALNGRDLGWYIRAPKNPKVDDDNLDIDSELCMAIVNYVAGSVSINPHNRNIFNKSARKIVKDYAFKIYKTEPKE